MLVAGPPSINASWFNISLAESWRSLHTPLNCPIDDLLCAVAIHIMDGLYTVSSLNASTYSLTIVSTSRQNAADFAKLIHALKAALDQARPDDTVYAFTKEQLVN